MTNRNLGKRIPIKPSKLEALVRSAQTIENANLQLITANKDLDELGDIIGNTDRLRLLHPRGHADFVNEIRWTKEEVELTRDGIDLATVDLCCSERAALQLARDESVVEHLRNWRCGKAFESLGKKSIKAASAIGLVRIRGRSTATFFDGGRAVQRVWLEASRQQLAFQPLSSITFLIGRMLAGSEPDDLRSSEMNSALVRLRARFLRVFPTTKDYHDVLLFRIAVADPPTVKSLRRPVDDVLFFSSSAR